MRKIAIFILIIAMIGMSCQDEQTAVKSPVLTVYSTSPLVKETTEILGELLTEKDVNGIASIIKKGYYVDERIKVSDILEPQVSGIQKLRADPDLGLKERFLQARSLRSNSAGRTTEEITNSDLVLYFPYSEEFTEKIGEFTLVADPGDNPNEAWGMKISGRNREPVLVNDDGCITN